MPTEVVNKATRQEWRELGFFYERDDANKEWRLVGSHDGLLGFANILLKYSENPRNKRLSEHDHLGPYMYLEIGTWSEAQTTGHWIAGTLADLERLSALIEEALRRAQIGEHLRFRETYAPASPYELLIKVADERFDPASADAACW